LSDRRKHTTGAQRHGKPQASSDPQDNATQAASTWQDLHFKFDRLAELEKRSTVVIGTYGQGGATETVLDSSARLKQLEDFWANRGEPRKGPVYLRDVSETGRWRLHGVSLSFGEKFHDYALEAGKAYGCPTDRDAKDLWLHKLYFYLWENKAREHVRSFDRSRKGRAIVRVCEASATFCSWLERKSLAVKSGSKSPPTVQLSDRERNLWKVIQRGTAGRRYCRELDNAQIAPPRKGVWRDGPRKYLAAYGMGKPWRHRIEDEKSKVRRKAKVFEFKVQIPSQAFL
jgi:hypothetical protein